MLAHPIVHWTEAGEARSARWRSERGAPPPKRVVIADDRMTADDAYGLACQGTALLWRGDFQNARQMLTALASRADRQPRKAKSPLPASPADAFHLHRQAQSQRARTLGDAAGAARRGLWHSVATCARHPPSLRGSLRPGGGDRRSLRCASCWASSARTSGAEGNRDPGDRRPHPSALRRVRADSPRVCRPGRQGAPAGPRRRRRAWPSTSAPERACWLPCSHGAASSAWSPPTRIRARWRALARISNASGWPTKWRSCRRISFPKDAPRSWYAIRRGFPRDRALPSSAASTTPRAACCADSSSRCPRTWNLGARAG